MIAKIAELSLRTVNWTFEGDVPSIPKWVGLAVPHTSNWDGLLMMFMAHQVSLKMRWMIKDSWIKGPVGAFFKSVGAVAVDRSKAGGLVESMVAEFDRCNEMALVVPPAGTRDKRELWKSGFYHIARGANVPVVPGYLDYTRKRAGFGAPIYLTGDVKRDMDKIREFYANHPATARKPDLVTPIRLKEE